MTKRSVHEAPALVIDDSALEFMQVLWSVEHALERVSKLMEQRIGISGPQRFALRLIGQYPGIGAGQLAGALYLHPSTVTGMLQRLERRGLVRRVQHPADARRIHLFLTREAVRINRPGVRGTVEHAVRKMLARTAARQRQAATDVLERFYHELMQL